MPHAPKKRLPELERFWSKINVTGDSSECWEWMGVTNHGYGHFRVGDRKVYAHRYAYHTEHPEFALHPTSDKRARQFLLHSCDNRRCCNPKHLSVGNYEDNSRGMVKKGRSKDQTGEQNPRAILGEVDVIEIRRLVDVGAGLSELGRKYGVTPQTVWRIKERMTWQHL